MFGLPADWDTLERLGRRYGLPLIDGCCEALGAEYRGRRLGSFGDAGAFAFYPNKQITTGEGGMIVTDRDDLAALAAAAPTRGAAPWAPGSEHARMGYNYRMDEMSAALGLSQMGRIDQLLARRERVARMYREGLAAALPEVRSPNPPARAGASWFAFVVTLPEGCDRDRTIAGMEPEGVPARGCFAPIHTQPYIRERFGDLEGTLPVTEAVARRTLALPFHNRLIGAQVDRVLGALRRHLH